MITAVRHATSAWAALLLLSPALFAHKPITSKYNYNEHVFPILRDHCGGCHTTGGVAPMSLMTYQDALPWGESIRLELIDGNMPPWYAESESAGFRDSHRLAPRDLDVLMTWASGGTPEGPPRPVPGSAMAPVRGWTLGPPDLEIKVPAPVTLAPGELRSTREFVLSGPEPRDRWIRAIDLVPENPALVRHAAIFARSPATGAITTLALWLPARPPVAFETDMAIRWPANAELAVRIQYRKTWKYEDEEMTDRSTVGIYFAPVARREVRSLEILPAGLELSAGVRILALHTDTAAGAEDAEITIESTEAGRNRPAVLATIGARDGWDQRYWFSNGVTLRRGAVVRARTSSAATARVWICVVAPR